MLTLKDAKGNFLMSVSEKGDVTISQELVNKTAPEVLDSLVKSGKLEDKMAQKAKTKINKKKKKNVKVIEEDKIEETEEETL